MTPNPHPASGNGDVIERAKKLIREHTYTDENDHIVDLLASANLIGSSSWRPIETAKKEHGRVVFIGELRNRSIALAIWHENEGWLFQFNNQPIPFEPDVWHPAPERPSAGLLKLSEGSGSNRDAMVHVDAACGFLVSIRPRSDTGSAKKQAIESALEQLAGAKLALASVPEGSGDGKMREALATIANSECQNFGTDELRAIAREALATPAPSPIDAEGMRRKNAEISAHLADCTKCGICGELICPCEEGLVPCGKDQCPIQKGDRALPTPAREIDREKIATAFAKDFPAVLAQYSQYKITDWFLNLIGGRHV